MTFGTAIKKLEKLSVTSIWISIILCEVIIHCNHSNGILYHIHVHVVTVTIVTEYYITYMYMYIKYTVTIVTEYYNTIINLYSVLHSYMYHNNTHISVTMATKQFPLYMYITINITYCHHSNSM